MEQVTTEGPPRGGMPVWLTVSAAVPACTAASPARLHNQQRPVAHVSIQAGDATRGEPPVDPAPHLPRRHGRQVLEREQPRAGEVARQPGGGPARVAVHVRRRAAAAHASAARRHGLARRGVARDGGACGIGWRLVGWLGGWAGRCVLSGALQASRLHSVALARQPYAQPYMTGEEASWRVAPADRHVMKGPPRRPCTNTTSSSGGPCASRPLPCMLAAASGRHCGSSSPGRGVPQSPGAESASKGRCAGQARGPGAQVSGTGGDCAAPALPPSCPCQSAAAHVQRACGSRRQGQGGVRSAGGVRLSADYQQIISEYQQIISRLSAGARRRAISRRRRLALPGRS